MTKFSKGQKVQPKGYEVATVVTGNENKAGEIVVEFSGGVRRWFRPEKLQPVKSDEAEAIGKAAARAVLDIETRSGVDLASGPDKAVMVTMKNGKLVKVEEITQGRWSGNRINPAQMKRHKVPKRGWQAHLWVTGRVDDPKAVLSAQDRKERRMWANRRPI